MKSAFGVEHGGEIEKAFSAGAFKPVKAAVSGMRSAGLGISNAGSSIGNMGRRAVGSASAPKAMAGLGGIKAGGGLKKLGTGIATHPHEAMLHAGGAASVGGASAAGMKIHSNNQQRQFR